jgi:type II secretory pathway pseudopilin PulG
LNNADTPEKVRRPKRLILFVVITLVVLGAAATGGVIWYNLDQAHQAQARAEDAQRVLDEAASKKKAASDAYWAKAYADDKKLKSDQAQAKAAADAQAKAAAASDLAAKGWKPAATGIYTADIPGGYRCTTLPCNKFLVMTTQAGGCPNGILIRGRWLHSGVVMGPINEVTGSLREGEQAAVEILDYTRNSDTVDLTEFRCN